MRFMCLLPALALVPAVPAGAADLTGTLGLDPTRLAGTDDLDRMLLYTPDPREQGSSVSHWDPLAAPNLLMEPFASPDVPLGQVDLTLPHFRDMGWPQGSSTVTIRVNDAPDEGFNDPTIVAEAPGNPGGTTLGGQRLAVMQWAAGIWAAQLGSTVEINIDSAFLELDCDPDGGAALASAGARFLFFDFPNAPRQETWYHGALAESLANENLSSTEDGQPPNAGDLAVNFNSQIDENCLAPSHRFYYGLDGNTPQGQASFAMVALHEMGHGLGFATFIEGASGAPPFRPGIPPMPDIYTVFMFDKDVQLHWSVMSNSQRRASTVNTHRVVWDGPQTTSATADILGNAPMLTTGGPRSVAGNYMVQGAPRFGPPIDSAGVTADLALVNDGSDDPTLGCNALVNAAEIAGKIAVVDRGECLFTIKVKNAQDAGAVAVIIVNNLPKGLPPMGGADATITIPSGGISQADGERIKSVLESGRVRRGERRVSPDGESTP
jgi:hypothetical protein